LLDTLRTRRRSPIEEAVLRVLPADGALLTGEIAKRIDYPPTSALRGLRGLEAAGLVVCVDRSTCPSGSALWRRA
jgi:DNA-binding MarR family transcriptional regulator